MPPLPPPASSPCLPSGPLRVAVVGSGALGSELCRLLLERNHPGLLLIDPDTLQPHNLPLSPLFQAAGPSVLGRPKAELLCTLAQARSPHLHWQARCVEIADLGLLELQSTHLLVSCTDSTLARVETCFTARALGLPLLDAGVHSAGIPQGRVTWYPPQPGAACHLCTLTERRRAELLAFALSPSLGCTLPADTIPSPMTGAPAAIRATALALLALIDRFRDLPAHASFSQRISEPPTAPETIDLPKSPTCPWHSLPPLQPLPEDQPLHSLLPPDTVLELAWPLCLQARCRSCGHRFTPHRRTALVRRSLPCPACHLRGTLEPLQSLASLTASSPLARHTLTELGLPPRNLYHLRSALRPQPS